MAANNSTNTRSKGKTDSRVEINRADRERIIRIVSENYHHHVGQKMSRSKLKKAISHQLGHVTESRIIGESIKSVYGSTVTISSRKVKAHGPIKSMSFYIGLCARDSCNVTSRSGDSPARQAEAVCATEFNNRKNNSDTDRSAVVTSALDSESNAPSGQQAEVPATESSKTRVLADKRSLCAIDSCNATSDGPARQAEAVCATEFNHRKNNSDTDCSAGVAGALDSESNALSGQQAERPATNISKTPAKKRVNATEHMQDKVKVSNYLKSNYHFHQAVHFPQGEVLKEVGDLTGRNMSARFVGNLLAPMFARQVKTKFIARWNGKKSVRVPFYTNLCKTCNCSNLQQANVPATQNLQNSNESAVLSQTQRPPNSSIATGNIVSQTNDSDFGQLPIDITQNEMDDIFRNIMPTISLESQDFAAEKQRMQDEIDKLRKEMENKSKSHQLEMANVIKENQELKSKQNKIQSNGDKRIRWLKHESQQTYYYMALTKTKLFNQMSFDENYFNINQLEVPGHAIAAGAYGQVFQAHVKNDGRVIALKRFRQADHCLKEAKILKFLTNNNLNKPVWPTFIGITRDHLFLAMTFICGSTFSHVCRKETLTEKETLKMVAHVGYSLYLLHREGVVHGDLSGRNVMISSKETGLMATLLDLGLAELPTLAKPFDYRGQSKECDWMDPKVFDGTEARSFHTDYYSFGMLCKKAFEAFNCQALRIVHEKCCCQNSRLRWTPYHSYCYLRDQMHYLK